MSGRDHWDAVYGGRETEALTWYEAEATCSLELIRAHAPGGAAVDVGAGASSLAGHLIDAGFAPVTALDLSATALAGSRRRLGARAAAVDWLVADVTAWEPTCSHALWHDRAVFHFLTGAEDRARYVAVMARALVPGGVAVIATFAEDGPERCSGLPVRRYAPEALVAEIERLAPGAFAPVTSLRHLHLTPKGNAQPFQFSVLRRVGA